MSSQPFTTSVGATTRCLLSVGTESGGFEP